METPMISQSAEYSLRALICLAQSRGSPLTNQQIAERARIPSGYLAKILQALGRAGMVSSQRGLNGGFLLTAQPETVTLLEVVRLTDPSRRIGTCPLGVHGHHLCPLHRRLDDAAAAVEAALARTTLAQLLAEQQDPFADCINETAKAGTHD
jgi:Rrf2 family protein